MSKKSISINPNFLKIGKSGKTPKQKKEKKRRPINTLKPNNVKKKLIEKIKAHQQREKEKEILADEKEEREFQDSFKDTLNYLQELDLKSKKKKKKKKKRDKTMKKSNIPINTQPMENKSSSFSHAPAPPYGCLKGGNKPTFRQYNKTLKKTHKSNQEIPINTSNNFDGDKTDVIDTPVINLTSIKFEQDKTFDTRKEKLQNLKNMMKTEKPKKRRIKTRRIRRKITLGKVKNKVGVLVKSKQTRKIIKNEVSVLKKKPIQEIKSYLKKHNLIKIGSSAPDYIFRTMYENAYLSGDISNKNDEILLHNWSKEIPA